MCPLLRNLNTNNVQDMTFHVLVSRSVSDDFCIRNILQNKLAEGGRPGTESMGL